ncbi:MAG: cell division protein ZapA [Firmicutes bacterium]|nr:cell division protein ZapA [Bacillota bacterium]
MENNKVKVKIYGQEYVISGEMSKEDIIQVAAHVDMKMREIADAAAAAGATPSNVAILAAANITGDQFQMTKEIEELKRLNAQLEKDAQHYVQLWDESKKNYADYKEETQAMVLQKDELNRQLREKDAEIARLKDAAEAAMVQMQSGMDDVIKEVEDKCRELENSFFDLQMENLQLKKELERTKSENSIEQMSIGQIYD